MRQRLRASTSDQLDRLRPGGRSGSPRRMITGAALALTATAGALAFTAGCAAPARSAAPVRQDATWVARSTAPTRSGAARDAQQQPGQPPDPVLAQKVAAWVTGGGEAELKALGRDFKALETDAKAQNLPAMGSDCKQLGVDVAAGQAYAPIPDTEAQTSWAAALDQYAHGAADCMNGAMTQDYTRITKAATEIQTGSTELDKVTARLNEIAG